MEITSGLLGRVFERCLCVDRFGPLYIIELV